MNPGRYLPVASDRDRISAARYATEQLHRTIARLIKHPHHAGLQLLPDVTNGVVLRRKKGA